jgi:hypothetical protein
MKPDLKPIWERAFTNELGRLAQCIITYGRLVCDIRPHKTEQHCVRLTFGGDRIDYPGETYTKNADRTTSECLWNSVVSTDAAMYMCADVKKYI